MSWIGRSAAVGVGGDEVRPVHAAVDHGVEGVAAATTHAEHLDDRLVLGGTLELQQIVHALADSDESHRYAELAMDPDGVLLSPGPGRPESIVVVAWRMNSGSMSTVAQPM